MKGTSTCTEFLFLRTTITIKLVVTLIFTLPEVVWVFIVIMDEKIRFYAYFLGKVFLKKIRSKKSKN